MRMIKCLLILCFAVLLEAAPSYFLTWNDDPTTTMIISWLEKEKPYTFSYLDQDEWQIPPIQRTLLLDRVLARVVLTDLTPDTAYKMRFDQVDASAFKTLPTRLDKPLYFACGGDVFYGNGEVCRQMCHAVASKNPDFVILGGDIAYTLKHGIPKGSEAWEGQRWETFFTIWNQEMGSTPLLIAVGNHDITKDHDTVADLFALRQSYQSFQLGQTALILLLDTEHSSPIAGEQSTWLSETLARHAHLPFKSAHYHIAAYPSYASYEGFKPKQVRTHWVPLFEEHALTVAFEHHNHTYKRTYPLLGHEPHPNGIIYLGDGSWGICPRQVRSMPYLAHAAPLNAFYLVSLDDSSHSIASYDLHGNIIEQIQPVD